MSDLSIFNYSQLSFHDTRKLGFDNEIANYALQQIDTNKDGKISEEEYIKAYKIDKNNPVLKTISSFSINNINSNNCGQIKGQRTSEGNEEESKKIISQGLASIGGDTLNPNILNALTDGLTNYLQDNDIKRADIDTLVDSKFKSYLDGLGINSTTSDLQNVKEVIKNLTDLSGHKDGDDESLSMVDFNSILNEYAASLNGNSESLDSTFATYIDNSNQMLDSYKGVITDGLNLLGGDKMNQDVLKALTEGLVSVLPNADIKRDEIGSVIDNAFKPYLDGMGISYTDDDLNNAKTVLTNLMDCCGEKDHNKDTLSMLDFTSIVKDYADISKKVTVQGLSVIGGDKMSPEVMSTLADTLMIALPHGNIEKDKIDSLVDNEFKNYLDAQGIPYTDSDLNDVKTVVKNLTDLAAENDGDNASLSFADYTKILHEVAPYYQEEAKEFGSFEKPTTTDPTDNNPQPISPSTRR